MSISELEPSNQASVTQLHPEWDEYQQRGSLYDLEDVLDTWDAATEASYAAQVEPVPTTESMQIVEHKGVKSRMFVVDTQDPLLSKDKTGTVAITGFMAPPEAYLAFCRAYTAITHSPIAVMDQPVTHGGIRRYRDFHPNHIFDPFRLEGQIVAAAIEALRTQRTDAPEEYDAICHSKGGGVGSEAAAARPDLFGKLVLAESVGIIPHAFLPMVGRLGAVGINEVPGYIKSMERDDRVAVGRAAAGKVITGRSRLVLEGYRAATTTRLHYDIAKASSEGVEITALWGTRDGFFPPEAEVTDDILRLISKGLIMDIDHMPEQRAALGAGFLLQNLVLQSPLVSIAGGRA